MEFRLPELGEGIADATVVNVPVKAGDSVTSGQTLIEVETDKASMAVPSPAEGSITEVRVKPGDKIRVGAILLVFAEKKGNSTAKPSSKPQPEVKSIAKQEAPAKPEKPAAKAQSIDYQLPALGEGIDGGTIVSVAVKQGDVVKKEQELFTIETDKASVPVPSPVDGVVEAILVKSGDKVVVGAVVARLSAQASEKPAAANAPSPSKAPDGTAPAKDVKPIPSMSTENGAKSSKKLVPAGPATRRLARELGVSLQEISGSARGGRIVIDDIKAFVRKRLTQAPPSTTSAPNMEAPPLPDFSKFGAIEKKPISNLRRKIAENLTLAWRVAPAVTQYDLADITDLEAGRKRVVDQRSKDSPKITMTVLAVKAIVAALKEFPSFNSSLDMASGELILKQYCHIGIAVDTERGLIVPVIRDADKKGIRDLAKEIAELAEKARSSKLTIDEMRGGCFTITNLGGIGGTAFSPIINYPEVAILGIARSSLQPIIRDGNVAIRLMMPLCLSYDHRVIDGAAAARFTTRLVQLFSDPIRLLMES